MAIPGNTAREKAIAEWRRRKRNGEHTGPTAHLTYGKFSRPVARSLDLTRPPLGNPDTDEIERLYKRYADEQQGHRRQVEAPATPATATSGLT